MKKTAKIKTPLQAHQQRVVDRIQQDDQPGLVVAHGMGSGKTLTSIAAADALGGDAQVVVPAALQTNYAKEIAKHAPSPAAQFHVDSLQRVARGGALSPARTLIVDEAHRLRESATSGAQAIHKAKADKRLLLTGTPFYNHPHDVAALVNIAAGKSMLPAARSDFEKRFVQNVAQRPGFFARHLRGIKPGEVKALKNKGELKEILGKWVDYHENSREDFPERQDEVIRTPLTERQQEIYNHVLGTAPAWLRYKIRKGLPPTKQEAQNLNAFLTGVRQVSLSPGGYDAALTPQQAAQHSSKLQAAADRLQAALKNNPQHRALVYSNFLEAGVDPYAAELTRRGIAYGQFTGAQTKKERDAQVTAYNEGKTPVLLVSSAGGEGLDLKGTRQIQLLDPHFNKEKLEQVIARGIRYKSHEALSPSERKVLVEHYLSTPRAPGMLARLLGKKQDRGADEYLEQLSADKDRLNEEARSLLRQKTAAAVFTKIISGVRT